MALLTAEDAGKRVKAAPTPGRDPAVLRNYQPVVDISACDGYKVAIMFQVYQPQVDVQESSGPDWPGVHTLAAGQAGHFTAAQAKANGFSEQLLSKHVGSGNLERPVRGIYRIATFPPAEHEDLVVAWLWTRGEGVISHESALQIHALSDALPARIHITLPLKEAGRRRVVPPTYVLHYADIPPAERAWVGPVPVTTPARTVCDVAAAHGDAAIVKQAIDQGIQRRFFEASHVAPASAYAAGFQIAGWRVFPEAVADLGDCWVMRPFSGTCVKPPPTDWPTLAREIVEGHGGKLYYQGHHPGSGTVSVHVAWPMPGPDRGVVDALRHDLNTALGWR